MLQAISAPAHSDRHPHWKIHEQKLMKKMEVTANEIRNGEILESRDTDVTQLLHHIFH